MEHIIMYANIDKYSFYIYFPLYINPFVMRGCRCLYNTICGYPNWVPRCVIKELRGSVRVNDTYRILVVLTIPVLNSIHNPARVGLHSYFKQLYFQ